MPEVSNPTPHRSRWGYHPCDYATYRLIKRLHWLWFRTLRRLAAWQRWNAKLPHNRVIWRRLRAAGKPVGWEQVGPWPEPALPAFMVEDRWGKRVIAHAWIDSFYRAAHRPAPEPVESWPLAKIQEIQDLLRQLETWCESRTSS
jgi:hypothetical protein